MSIAQIGTQGNTQLRQNLWLTPEGAVVGYGSILAPGGFYFCFTCGAVNCQHTQDLDREWLAGHDSVEIPFLGEPVGSGDESSEQARLGLPVEW